jgi:hypothetical protein
VKTHELTISPIEHLGKVYWLGKIYWNTTLPEFKEFEKWCKERRIRFTPAYTISRIATWDLFIFGVTDEKAALEFKIRWS